MSAQHESALPGERNGDPRLLSGFRFDVRSLPGDIRVVTLVGEIDLLFLARLQAVLLDELTAPARAVILDLTRVDFLAAGAVGVLAGAQRRAAARRIELHLVGAQRMVHRVFELTGLTGLLPCHPTVPDALRLLDPTGQA